MAVATKQLNQSVEDQRKVAQANLLRNKTRADRAGRVGYIIHSPAHGTILGGSLGKVVLPIHRHLIITKKGDTLDEDGRTSDEFYTYEGSTLAGVDGEWFTTDEVVAAYVRDYYGRAGYTVREVRRDTGTSILDSEAYLEARAIMEDEDEDYNAALGLGEAHPDTPRIIQE